MARLRAPGGCPWDREQTFDSIKRLTLEETYEVFDAIDRRAWPDLKDDLGDLLGGSPLDAPARTALLAAARAHLQAILAPLAEFASFGDLRAVGGTVFTVAAMLSGDPRRDGVRVDRAQRRSVIDALLARDVESRRRMANIRPQRADILPAGLIVVDAACDLLGIDALHVSHSDLLAGYLRSPHYRAGSLPRLG